MSSPTPDVRMFMDIMINIFKSIGELKGELKWIRALLDEAKDEARMLRELHEFQDAAKN